MRSLNGTVCGVSGTISPSEKSSGTIYCAEPPNSEGRTDEEPIHPDAHPEYKDSYYEEEIACKGSSHGHVRHSQYNDR
jgi:hypothetical protein